jgi:phosphoserine phosphatase RsbU/P
VLVVDDSRVQRRILNATLSRWGYSVDEAASGEAALQWLEGTHYDFVLSDWVMPGLDGLELCRRFRALPRDGYVYFILLTAMDEKSQVAEGLAVGADDFLSKPVDAAELHARMLAGERILEMERELTEKNRIVSETLAQLQSLYDALDRDLAEARALQMQLVRERDRDFGSARISVMLRPSGHIGGDLVGYIQLDARHVAFYAIDVSGHGVAAAMLAARLAGLLAGAAPGGNLMTGSATGECWPPEVFAARLNRMLLETMQIEQYLTCVYALADIESGQVTLVQAGHPHPVVVRAAGGVERIGAGGPPVGLLDGMRYERTTLQLAPGDRLLLMSDGLTEAAGPSGAELGEAGMLPLLERWRTLEGTAFLEALLWDVQAFSNDGDLADDISAVLYEFRGPPGAGRTR